MGIAYCMIRAAPAVVEQLRGRPRAVAEFIYQDPDLYEAPKVGFFARLLGGSRQDDRPGPPRTNGDETDLDKSWHIVHYLLSGETGSSEGPLGIIADEQDLLANLDLGLGKPNVLSPAKVAAFAAVAGAMSDADFLARYNPNDMPTDDLYLGEVIARGDHDDMKDYALENFRILRDFTTQAAAAGEAVITYYS